MTCQTATSNKVLPTGKLYLIDLATSAEVLLSQVENFNTTVATERFQEYGGDDPIAVLQIDKPTRVTRTGTLTARGITRDSLARFFIANATTITTTATPVVDESIASAGALVGGAWYQLGVSTARPAGIRNIGSVAITKDGATATAVAETGNYVLDATLGRFQVIAGGALDGAVGVRVDYTPVASTWEQIATAADLVPASVGIRWVANNLDGEHRDLFCPCVTMTPTGDVIWKSPERNEVQQLGFELSFTGDLYINGRAVAA